MRTATLLVPVYAAAIVYASLQPFTDWRWPPDPLFSFLFAPWPRYVTTGDILLNIAAYLPLGILLFMALRPPLSAMAAAGAATLLGTALSFMLESTQMFLPTRIASNADLLLNGIGSGSGACVAWAATRFPPLVRWQASQRGTLGDAGVILILSWIVMQAQPAPFAFGVGDWRGALPFTPLFEHTPESYLRAEAAATALMTAAIGLMVESLSPARRGVWLPAGMIVLLGALVKSLIAMPLAHAEHGLRWITPGVALGFIAGVLIFALSARLPPRGRAVTAALCVTGGLVIVNIAPENPYQTVFQFLLDPQFMNLASFSRLLHLLSAAWPLFALAYLALHARRGDGDRL